MPDPTAQTITITPASATALAKAILTSHGVPADRADLIATALTLADLRGVDTHGINRLPGYIARLQAGVVALDPELSFNTKTPTMALLDAKNTFGFVAGSMAIDKCVEMAQTYGMGMVAVRNSNHYGMGATYVLRAIKQGFACFAYTNASRAMPPWGGAEALLGTSPFAVGVPGGAEGDFVLDMSPCVAARGKMRKAVRRGESIPEGYALDAQGRPTTDPVAVIEGGVVLPIAGPKGSGLAMMMDIFAGVMSGSAFAGGVNDQYKEMEKPQGVGHWFLVFRPDVFLDGGVEEFRERMDTLLRTVRGVKKAEGFERIYVSGEMEAEVEEKRRTEGIPFTKAEVDALHYLGLQAGVQIKMEEVSK
ncbi:Malate/L-lactate dehydrogenase [Aspergillus pseudonomiae]|uniref:Malate/L-lactate dehydrogenase n=1 Tax=Aspergillus pseudonomiae TaxID=1506151 RepID=A0A5N7DHP9_9EURO|nr:Malate/L-lactate dehydrogenase [Aspergillus pseudonomiae]KAE8405649.1 Malate/L-lactate dehydrogenase [Aspergillus pseudonomiae]